MTDQINIHTELSNFHASVEKLAHENSISWLGRIYKSITNWYSGANTNPTLLRDVVKQAESILSAWPAENTLVSEEELQFNQDMDKLFKEVYPLAKKNITNSENKLPKSIQEYFSPEIGKLRQEKIDNPDLVSNANHKVLRKVAKGELAIKFGGGTEGTDGATGTLRILDVNHKPMGIFKVSDENIPTRTRALNYIKSIFWGQLSYLSRKHMAQPKSERAAFLLNQALGLDLVSPTSEVSIKDIKGVFQVFISKEKEKRAVEEVKEAQEKVENHVSAVKKNPFGKKEDKYFEAEKMISYFDAKNSYTNREKINVQKFAIFDYLTGNLDRHEKNWFVTFSAAGEVTNIKAIDNANAFPKKQPKVGSMASRNQYKWKSLKIAKEPLTPEAVDFIKQNVSPEKVKNFIELLKSDLPGFLDADMENLFSLRAQVLFKLAESHQNASLENLASYSTKEAMENFVAT